MVRLHEPTVRGRRRSVLVAVAMATGVLCAVAATNAYLALGGAGVTIGLVVLSGGTFAFAVLVHLGRYERLVADDQLLWLGEGEGE